MRKHTSVQLEKEFHPGSPGGFKTHVFSATECAHDVVSGRAGHNHTLKKKLPPTFLPFERECQLLFICVDSIRPLLLPIIKN